MPTIVAGSLHKAYYKFEYEKRDPYYLPVWVDGAFNAVFILMADMRKYPWVVPSLS